ncbi:MAG: HamA C-terminal domain-containing protein [Nitrososphaeraceae archaeon]
MDFTVLVDCSFLNLVSDTVLKPATNKHVVSVVNDFEDGLWRAEKFNNFIWDNIAETALSHKEREILAFQPQSLLKAAAKNLRLTDSDTDIGKGSELAEIVLYGIMKHKYGALPVVPKIFYKQNAQDNAKGADSVHIVLDSNNGFTLWFGEAKFYNSIEVARLDSIIQSIKNSLVTDKLKKENSIIVSLSDIDSLDIDDSLRLKIKSALSNRKSIDSLKPIINIPILLLHECEITASATEFSRDYIDSIAKYHKERAVAYFSKQVHVLNTIHWYEKIQFHLILFPVPKKEPIVNKFVSHVAFYKE